jgi:hypothetical protein
MVMAEPLPLPAQPPVRDALASPLYAAEDGPELPVDPAPWDPLETTDLMLVGLADEDRLALVRQAWQSRGPTWIQSGATVNLGDFPLLDDSSSAAERDLQTLEWMLEEQRRQAAGKPARPGSDDGASSPQDNWLRSLLPRQWIAGLKANREWVAVGGAVLLVILWGTAAFARRPGAAPSITPSASPPPRRRRQRHRSPAPTAPGPAAVHGARRTRT